MSEQGWREFLTAEGVDDWVVLHGGATALFRVPSLGEAARLAEAVANVPGLEGAGALLTIGDNHLSVRLSRGVFRLEEVTSTLRGQSRRSRGRKVPSPTAQVFKRFSCR
jgi:4a-hydroxytetrahydrobiopterin dehydratase